MWQYFLIETSYTKIYIGNFSFSFQANGEINQANCKRITSCNRSFSANMFARRNFHYFHYFIYCHWRNECWHDWNCDVNCTEVTKRKMPLHNSIRFLGAESISRLSMWTKLSKLNVKFQLFAFFNRTAIPSMIFQFVRERMDSFEIRTRWNPLIIAPQYFAHKLIHSHLKIRHGVKRDTMDYVNDKNSVHIRDR